jgi:fructose/tagatose bisphosphate aldolase
MPHVAESVSDLLSRLAGIVRIEGDGIAVEDEGRLRRDGIRDLAWTAAFSDQPDVIGAAQWLVWEASQALGARSASIHELYMARARGEVHGFTVPAINIRAQTFDMARTIFDAAQKADVGAVILELARSEQTYTFQRPIDYATAVLAGAIAADWQQPVFIQGDHYQFNAKKYQSDPEAMTEEIRRACRLAIEAGYRNIDIDSSTLVDLAQPTVAEQQSVNARNTAELTRLVRSLQPEGVTISVGGEIGEVGKANSTEEELRAYLDGYLAECGSIEPISKVSVQTGTSHGGVPMADGSVAEVKIDFATLARLSTVAREEYGMAGCVQHGASTLPDDAFHHFPANGTAEIHLATGFQNILYDEGGLPGELRAEMMAWCVANCADERKDGETDEQFLYKTRKKAIGPFKRQLWTLPESSAQEIGANLRAKFGLLFDELGIAGTREIVDRHVRPVAVPVPLPAPLGGRRGGVAVAAGAAVFEDDGSGE